METTQSNNRRGRKIVPVTTVGNSVNQGEKKKKNRDGRYGIARKPGNLNMTNLQNQRSGFFRIKGSDTLTPDGPFISQQNIFTSIRAHRNNV